MMPVILFIHLRGGTGKSSTLVALAECLAEQGKRIFVIDADQQRTASDLLLGENRMLQCDQQGLTFIDLISSLQHDQRTLDSFGAYAQRHFSTATAGYENLSVIPCSIRINEQQHIFASIWQDLQSHSTFDSARKERQREIRRWLHATYDFVLVDCPPSVDWKVQFVLALADTYIIPCIPDTLSVSGIKTLMQRLNDVGFRKPCLGILWTLYSEQNKTSRRIVGTAMEHVHPFDELPRPFDAIIPYTAAFPAARKNRAEKTPIDDKYTPTIAEVFRKLSTEIDRRC